MGSSTPLDKKKILVVEDDPKFGEAINFILSRNGYDVRLMSDSKEACNVAILEPFDLILSDIRMPGMTGIQLLHTLKRQIKTPIILMTGHSEMNEPNEAKEMGAADFIKKPFSKGMLLALLNKYIERPNQEIKSEFNASQQDSNEYYEVNINDFETNQYLKYNTYLKIGNGHFIKVSNAGEMIPQDRIQLYKSKGVKLFYIKKEDFHDYVRFSKSLTEAAKNNRNISNEKKVALTAHATQLLVEQYFFEGVNEHNFGASLEVVKTNLEIIDKDNYALSLINSLNQNNNSLFAHSTGVSLYSVMIAKNLGWTSDSTLTKLSIGGLFHDIGKKQLDPSILNKSKMLYTHDELKTYESHVTLGVQMLSHLPMIHSDILLIVQQHHEHSDGYGFPSRLVSREIFALAKVVGLADTFCNLVIKNPNCQGFPIMEALKRINTISLEQHDKEVIGALNKIFNFK